jgi:L-ribulose-5-phosphate 4-epimerase
MTTVNLASIKREICDAAETLVQSGIMTKSNHGNISIRVPNQDAFLMTSGGGLASMKPENIALFRLDGSLIEGTVAPVGGEIIQMHAIVYRTRPEFNSVIHTHSPFATGFAVAGKMIPPAYEALVRNGMIAGVPLAGYGPRGSDQSVRNIESVLNEHTGIKGLLLENHGVLAFADSVNGAFRANMTIEESAEIMLYAYGVGGPKAIPTDEIAATRERAASFAAAGSYSAETPRT